MTQTNGERSKIRRDDGRQMADEKSSEAQAIFEGNDAWRSGRYMKIVGAGAGIQLSLESRAGTTV